MIIVLVRYKCKPGCREKYWEAINANAIGRFSQQEDGNIQYEYSYGLDDDELLLTEIWRDEAALEDHKNTDHFIKLGSLKAEFVEDTEIKRYNAEHV